MLDRDGKCTVGAVMLLVAANAVGFAWARASQHAHDSRASTLDPVAAVYEMERSTLEKHWILCGSYLPCIAVWMPALLILGRRRDVEAPQGWPGVQGRPPALPRRSL